MDQNIVLDSAVGCGDDDGGTETYRGGGDNAQRLYHVALQGIEFLVGKGHLYLL
jgi:hypothetical protein